MALKKFLSNFYNIYLTGLTILVTLPFLAPILLRLGLELPAKVIYFIYSFFCHQFAYRSIHLFDYQLAWCARDTGIWLGIWITAILVRWGKLKGVKWYWVIPFVVPIALDGGIQTIFTVLNVSSKGALIGMPLYMSTNLTRFMTGAIFGIGISLWLSPMVLDDTNTKVEKEKPVKSDSTWFGDFKAKFFDKEYKKILLLCFAMFPLYILIFGIWGFTSHEHGPLEPLDAVVKAPSEDFMIRRADGLCPTSGFQDLLALGCFLGRD